MDPEERLLRVQTARSTPDRIYETEAVSHAGLARHMAVATATAARRGGLELIARDGRVKGFKPGVYSFLAYLLAHEGHHRGQISMLARQVGHPLANSAMFGMW